MFGKVVKKALTSPVSPEFRPAFYYVLVAAILLNVAGISIRFFTDDPALYGILARNMAHGNNFSDLVYHGRGWLDKPHFPFWVAAISFKILGVNTFAYKLPALLFYFLSVFYTYKLALQCYGKRTALLAILILLTAQHAIMSNTDVRAEPYLMGLLMGGVFHFYRLKQKFSMQHLLLGSLFTACAVMTKGIYLLIPIGIAIIGDYLFRGDIKGLFQWRWLFAFLLVCVFVLPEVYTVYTQFDLHPEKVVFGRTNISGVKWFLWDSQFGRFNNNGYITNSHGDKFFFLHTLLWAFAPWAIIFYYALGKKLWDIIKRCPQPEYLGISASLIMLLIFSISKFQLPFYTNILFPFFAIITSNFIDRLAGRGELRFFKISQYIICGLLLAVLVTVAILFDADKLWVAVLIFVVGAVAAWLILSYAKEAYQPALLLSGVVVLMVNTWFVVVFYPAMASYKGDGVAAEYVNTYYPGIQIISTAPMADRFDFYMKQPVSYATPADIIQNPQPALVFANDASMEQLKTSALRLQVIKVFDNYFGENITMKFINKATRNDALTHFYLIQVSK